METAVPRALVSVITPFLNGRQFMAEAVASVLSQTYASWELLLVDDGSDDGSTELARQYAAAHPDRIRYFEHPGHRNRGMTVSRNLGISHSRGSYVALLDCDDVWMPEKLCEQVQILESHPDAVMVFGTPHYWRHWSPERTSGPGDCVPPLWTRANSIVPPPLMLLASYPLGPGGAPCPSDLLVRRQCLERVGGFVEEFTGIYQLYEDQAFLAKVYLAGAVYTADRVWTKYRFHDQSCIARVTRGGHYDHVRTFYLRWLRQYVRGASVQDPRVHAAIAAARRSDLLQRARRQVGRVSRLMARRRPVARTG